MRGHWLPALLLTLALALFAGFSWLTRHPDSVVLDWAENQPVIGPWAAQFRDLYSPPDTLDPLDPETEYRLAPRIEPVERVLLPDYLWVREGTRVHLSPDVSSPVAQTMTAITNLHRLEQRGDWFRVSGAGRKMEGWVHLPGYGENGPPLGSDPDPPGPLLPRPPDPDLLQIALDLFGETPRIDKLGPYTLYTDVRKPSLIARLAKLAGQMDDVYTARYGRRPLGTPAEIVVLFEKEAPYRMLQRRNPSLHGLTSTGHTGRGLVFFFVAGRKPVEVQSTLVHELGHLINRRALGPALPPWLDEGLADDLANGHLSPGGRYDPSRLNGIKINWGGHQTFEGGWASVLNLEAAIQEGRLPDLEKLLSWPWQEFMRGDSRLHYDASSLFIRFLLDGGEPRYSEAWIRFMDRVATGEQLTPELLRGLLDDSWDHINRRFHLWIGEQARRLRQGYELGVGEPSEPSESSGTSGASGDGGSDVGESPSPGRSNTT